MKVKPKRRRVFSIILAIVVGIVALPFVFSDLGPEEPLVQRIAIASSIFLLGGMLVGGVAYRRWPVSALCAWSPFAIGIAMLLGKLTIQGEEPYWSAIGAFLILPTVLSSFGGYTGYRLIRWFARQKRITE